MVAQEVGDRLVGSDETAERSERLGESTHDQIDIIISEPERREHLWEITNYALENFRAMGCEIGHTSTPIIPLFIRDDYKTFQVTHDLLEEGVFVNPVVTPAVAPQDTLIRYSLMATHTKEQVTRSLEAIEKVFKKNGIL